MNTYSPGHSVICVFLGHTITNIHLQALLSRLLRSVASHLAERCLGVDMLGGPLYEAIPSKTAST